MVKKLWKTKKTQGFFGFSLRSQKETKATNTQKPKKTLSFFGFSQFFNHHVIQKTKKTLSFFSFFQVKTKKNEKNLGKTKKNQTWASDQTFSEKFWFFGFLVFSRFFWFCQWSFPKESPNIVFCWFSQCFLFFWGFSPWIRFLGWIQEKFTENLGSWILDLDPRFLGWIQEKFTENLGSWILDPWVNHTCIQTWVQTWVQTWDFAIYPCLLKIYIKHCIYQ